MVEAEVGSLPEMLPVPVLVTSDRGVVMRANPAAGVAFGLPEDALVGRCVGELLRERRLSARVRSLCHAGQSLRLYVL